MAKTFILKILLKTFIENIYRERDGFKLHIYIYIYTYIYGWIKVTHGITLSNITPPNNLLLN